MFIDCYHTTELKKNLEKRIREIHSISSKLTSRNEVKSVPKASDTAEKNQKQQLLILLTKHIGIKSLINSTHLENHEKIENGITEAVE